MMFGIIMATGTGRGIQVRVSRCGGVTVTAWKVAALLILIKQMQFEIAMPSSTATWCLLAFSFFLAACAAYTPVNLSRFRFSSRAGYSKKCDSVQMSKSSAQESSLVDSIVGQRASDVSRLGLFSRQSQVFYAAASVFIDYKFCQWRANRLPDSEEEKKEEIWDRAHERNSKYLCNRFVALEGLWVKLGQYLSSRADIMPPSYLKELSKCQVV
jgi:hypothetical protein